MRMVSASTTVILSTYLRVIESSYSANSDLADFEAAERFLKDLKASGEAITPKAWRAEAAKLTMQKDFDYQKMRDMRDEIKGVENLRKAADRLAHEGQHQQKENER